MTSQDSDLRYRGHTIPELEAMWLFAREHGYRDEDFEPFFAGAQYGVEACEEQREELQKSIKRLIYPSCYGFMEVGE